MASISETVSLALAMIIGLGFFAALSDATAQLLLRMWGVTGALVLMALLEKGGRGLSRSRGSRRLPWGEFGRLALQAAVIGLIMACVTAAIAAGLLAPLARGEG